MSLKTLGDMGQCNPPDSRKNHWFLGLRRAAIKITLRLVHGKVITPGLILAFSLCC